MEILVRMGTGLTAVVRNGCLRMMLLLPCLLIVPQAHALGHDAKTGAAVRGDRLGMSDAVVATASPVLPYFEDEVMSDVDEDAESIENLHQQHIPALSPLEKAIQESLSLVGSPQDCPPLFLAHWLPLPNASACMTEAVNHLVGDLCVSIQWLCAEPPWIKWLEWFMSQNSEVSDILFEPESVSLLGDRGDASWRIRIFPANTGEPASPGTHQFRTRLLASVLTPRRSQGARSRTRASSAGSSLLADAHSSDHALTQPGK